MSKNLLRVIISSALIISAGLKAQADEEGDFQIWHTENQEINMFKNTKYAMEEEFRYGNDANELYYQHYDWGFVYDICKNFSIGATTARSMS